MDKFQIQIDKRKAARYLIGSLALISFETYLIISTGFYGYLDYISNTKSLIIQIVAVPFAFYSALCIMPQAILSLKIGNPAITKAGDCVEVMGAIYSSSDVSFEIRSLICGEFIVAATSGVHILIPTKFLDQHSRWTYRSLV